MLYKIIFKNYRYNMKNYILFSIGNMFAIAECFAFFGILEIFVLRQHVEFLTSDIEGYYIISAVLVLTIMIFQMVYIMQQYVKLRIKDYSMLVVLGMRKKRMIILIFAEYVAGWLLSVLIGLVLGNGLLYGFNIFFNRIGNLPLDSFHIGFLTYRNTISTCFILMLIVYLALMTWMDGKKLNELGTKSSVNEKRTVGKGYFIPVFFGIFILALGCVQLQTNGWGWFVAYVELIVGALMLLMFCGGFILDIVQKRNYYIKHIFQINSLFSKYKSSMSLIGIFLAISFSVMGCLAIGIASALPIIQTRSVYPYDYIVMGKEENHNMIDNIADKQEGRLDSIPMLRVTSNTFREHIGISASSYEMLTGKKIRLSGHEISIVIGNRKMSKEKDITPKVLRTDYEHLYIGKYVPEMYKVISGNIVGGHYSSENTFAIKSAKTKNEIGDYSKSVYPTYNYSFVNTENLIIFSDAFFEERWREEKADPGEPTYLFLLKIPASNRKQVGAELKVYHDQYGIKDYTSQYSLGFQKSYYDTGELLSTLEHNLTFVVEFLSIIAITMVFSGSFLLGTKLLSDYDSYVQKYNFLKVMGMHESERKKTFYSEVMNFMWLSYLPAVLLSALSLLSHMLVTARHGRTFESGFFFTWLFLSVGYGVIEYSITRFAAYYYFKKINNCIYRDSK